MKLLADENIDTAIVVRLRQDGHSVLHVTEMEPGITDEVVLHRANEHSALLLTEDKDFGELVFRHRLVHQGVVLLRLDGLSISSVGEIVSATLIRHGSAMMNGFTVISRGRVRIRRNV